MWYYLNVIRIRFCSLNQPNHWLANKMLWICRKINKSIPQNHPPRVNISLMPKLNFLKFLWRNNTHPPHPPSHLSRHVSIRERPQMTVGTHGSFVLRPAATFPPWHTTHCTLIGSPVGLHISETPQWRWALYARYRLCGAFSGWAKEKKLVWASTSPPTRWHIYLIHNTFHHRHGPHLFVAANALIGRPEVALWGQAHPRNVGRRPSP